MGAHQHRRAAGQRFGDHEAEVLLVRWQRQQGRASERIGFALALEPAAENHTMTGITALNTCAELCHVVGFAVASDH